NSARIKRRRSKPVTLRDELWKHVAEGLPGSLDGDFGALRGRPAVRVATRIAVCDVGHRILLEGPNHAFELPRVDPVVAVEVLDVFATRDPTAGLTNHSGTAIMSQMKDFGARLSACQGIEKLRGLASRSVINKNQLEMRVSLKQNALD